MANSITSLSMAQLIAGIKQRTYSCVEVTQAFTQRIARLNPSIQAFVTVTTEQALNQARLLDEKLARGENPGRLCGIPVAIKDNMHVQGVATTCSSRMLEHYIAPYDAAVVELLRREGAVFIGKTNLDEFAMGSSTENSAFFTTHNPWDTSCIPGGSSGGSAACVAADMAPIALGSDTGGSIRQPAACCGVVGLKPTYGRVSRYGLVAFASSLDQIGPFARSAEDAAVLLETIAHHDPRDSTSLDVPALPYTQAMVTKGRKLRIGLPKEYFIDGVDPEVRSAVTAALKVYEKLGMEVIDISLPHTAYAVAVYYLIAPSEASANLARYDGVKYGYRQKDAAGLYEMYTTTRGNGFGPEVKRRIMLGTYALSAGYYDAFYGKAQKVRTLIRQDFEKTFEQVDIIATPTTPTPAFKIGEKSADPLQMYLSDIFTISCNLAGIPGVSLPCGFSSAGLPIGLQLMAPPFAEADLLSAAYIYQKETDWHCRRPAL